LGVEGVTGSTFASTRSAATLSPNSSFPIQGKEKEKVKKKGGSNEVGCDIEPQQFISYQRKRKKKKEKRGGERGRLRR